MRGLLKDKKRRGRNASGHEGRWGEGLSAPEKEKGDLYVFEWRNNEGTIGSAIAEDLKEAKKKLWRDLKILGHVWTMKQLRRGKKYRVTRINLSR